MKFRSQIAQLVGQALVIAAVAPALPSCATDAAPAPVVLDQKAKNIPVIDAAKQRMIKGPVIKMKPGEDKMLCWVPDWIPDKDYHVSKSLVLQGSMGHHLVTMKSDDPMKPGTVFECSGVGDMINLRPLILPDNSTKKTLDVMPPGHAVKLPKGASIVMQSHYVNVSGKDMEFQDVAILDLSDQPPAVEVGYLIVNDSKINIPVGQTWSHTSKCKVAYDINILATLGHMHEWGTDITVNIVPPGADPAKPEAPQLMYQVPKWLAEYRDSGPLTQYKDATKPMVVKAGSTIEVTCTWKNTETKPIIYPHEMCVSVSYYYPSKGLLLCDPD